MNATASQRRAQHQLIGSRIAALEEEIRLLKSRQNELAEISQLPPEILGQIFVCYRLSCGPRSERYHYHKHESLDWTKVTHVSRNWRAVALACPQLWSIIDAADRRWASVMLDRSNPFPISFTWNRSLCEWHASLEKDIANKVLSQSHRLECLEIDNTLTVFNTLVTQLTAPTPVLRRLKLRTRATDFDKEHDIPLPTGFLGNNASQLRHLELTSFVVPWHAISFKNLRTLKLSRSTSTSPFHPEPEPFFKAIAEMEDLRCLHLFDAGLPIAPLPTKRIISLHRLETFTLKGSQRECENVLKHLAIPASATLDIWCHTTADDRLSSVSDLVSAATSSWLSSPLSNSVAPSPVKSLAFDRYERAKIYLQAVVNFKNPGLGIYIKDCRDDTAPWTSDLVSALPSDKIEMLGLSTSMPEMTLAVLSQLPRLHTVCIDSAATKFCRYIAADPAIQGQKPREPFEKAPVATGATAEKLPPTPLTRFLSLTTLICSRVDFRRDISVADFEKLLMLRSEKGRPLRSLRLEGCLGLRRPEVDRLAKVVDHVEGTGNHYYDSDS
ncbi:hypothetical protein CC1G_07922 [Coprinopsis cinerea okayama7|uniref:Uncharacterized protein n=1 Tax=Coprinopsis cinerea (strain Okayama-7 / 130 / ATCC MYA-4618 / FGSC 9003) TaxID=240176 RepID=A8P6R0_COPC7|nr:hypothetical protein CC1G_07922 [Coprinopsis cinerea okayama7\|eukprot:XP_001839207.1 hypothetical protein CC1G_07922 [Coprinopsis cinerea okayama7\